MARIDSLLSIVLQQGADELRIAVDRDPKMLAGGAPKKLSIPAMSEETLRELLGEILSVDTEAELVASSRVELLYESGSAGAFRVTLTRGAGAPLEVRFVRARNIPRAKEPTAPTSAATNAPIVAADQPREPVVALEPPSATPPTTRRTGRIEVRRTLASLGARAAAMRASDLHLADGERVFVRVDGKVRAIDESAEVDVAEELGLSSADAALVRSGRSIDASLDVDGVGRVRVHVYGTDKGIAAALRLLPPRAPTFASLEMPVAFDDLAMLPHGLVLVCGATGAGKSTTLAALARTALERRSIVLVTLEDPIEYELESSSSSLVRRRQIGRDAVDFASGLRDALREDPDVLLVGEMRDPETVALALTAAETGHLVLASLHSRSAASAIDRIVDVSAPERQQQTRVQLAESLRAVVSQRLVPRARGSGRVVVTEVLRVNHAVASMIREAKTSQIGNAIQAGRSEGMVSLERCLAERVQSGHVRLEDARAVAHDVPALMMLLEGRRA